MDYKEYMILEQWKEVPIEKIIEIKNAAKRLILLNSEKYAFFVFLLVFLAYPIGVSTVNFMHGIRYITINGVIYLFIWFFYLKKKHVNRDLQNAAIKRLYEMEIVLKYRNI